MTTTAESLTAHLDEDEASANAAAATPATARYASGADIGPALNRLLFHRRFNTARVLADVAAKRAVLAEVMSWGHTYVDGDTWLSCAQAISPFDEDGVPGSGCADENRAGGPCDCGLDQRRATILDALAAPYPDHQPRAERP